MTADNASIPIAQFRLQPVFTALRNLASGILRLRKSRNACRLKLIETLSLGGKRQLLVVSCDGREFLLGAGHETITVIVPVGIGSATSAMSAHIEAACDSDQGKWTRPSSELSQ